MATIIGDSGDNTLTGTPDADTIEGSIGNDSISGGDGADVIVGGEPGLVSAESLNWTLEGSNGADLTAGFTQTTGQIDVKVTLTDDGAGTTGAVSTSTTYVEGGEPFDSTSSLALRGDGGASAWTATFDFAANDADVADEVEDLRFRIHDVDQSGWQDIVTVLAFDAFGNALDVTLTAAGDDSVDGGTITAGPSATGASDAAGSVLVEIGGPVAKVQVIYANGGTSGQLLYLSDLHFNGVPRDDDTLAGEAGDDSIFGNAGDDVITGGTGNDSISGGSGRDSLSGDDGNDTLTGGDGADTVFGAAGHDTLYGGTEQDTLFGGAGNDTLDGGAGGDTLFGGDGVDTLIAQGGDSVVGGEGGDDTGDTLIVDDVDRVEFDPSDNEAGTVFFNDGTTLDFTQIEQLVVNGGPTGTVDGTDGADLIDAAYVDAELEQVDNADGTLGTSGDDDVIAAGMGSDTVFAGAGNDLVFGGADALPPEAESLRWVAEGNTGTDLFGGFSQSTGNATLTVSITNDDGLSQSVVSGATQYVATGEPMSTASSLSLSGNGASDVATVTVASDRALENIRFRINDIDSGGWQDILTVTALDADGAPVTVTLTATGDDSVAGETVTGGSVNDDADLANGSVLVEIAGPATSFEITYENGSTAGQIVYITDVHFDAHPDDDDTLHGDQGDDTLFGQMGDDALFGGTGDDTLDGGAGADVLHGGDDQDTFFGGGGDTVFGGSGGTDFDTLYLGAFGTTIAYGDGDPESGTVEFADGSILTFSDIERIVPCFTPGTLIRTDRGDVAVETLRVGDLVLTKDAGFQPLTWVGMRHVTAAMLAKTPELRPVRIGAGALGPGLPERDMMVSPQHRMLIEGPNVQLLLGEDEVLVKAKDMLHRPGIRVSNVAEVTYIHVMCAAHQIVKANGTWSESFQPGDMVDGDREMFGELVRLFPQLGEASGRETYVAARLSAKWHEARLVC